MGAEDDAYLGVDEDGTPLTGGSERPSARCRPLGRTDASGGNFEGQQVVPTAVVDEIQRGASRDAFVAGDYPTLPAGATVRSGGYRTTTTACMARGIHGQAIYVDPKAEMVIARFASHPMVRTSTLIRPRCPRIARSRNIDGARGMTACRHGREI